MIELLQRWATLAPDEVRIVGPMQDHKSRTFWMVYFTCFGQYFITLSDQPMSKTEQAYADCLVQGAVERAVVARRFEFNTRELKGQCGLSIEADGDTALGTVARFDGGTRLTEAALLAYIKLLEDSGEEE